MPSDTNEPVALILSALGWILADDARAQRLLALTGLGPDDLRARIEDPALLRAVVDYLEGHERDLIDCAQALGVGPLDLLAARDAL